MNRLKGEVALALPDDRNLTLVLDHEALISAEGAFGEPMHLLLAKMELGFVGAVRAFLWGALRTHHPEITKTDAAAILFEHGELVQEALKQAREAAAPDAPEPDEEAEGNAPRRQDGKTSGGNGAKSGSSPKRSSKQPRAVTQ